MNPLHRTTRMLRSGFLFAIAFGTVLATREAHAITPAYGSLSGSGAVLLSGSISVSSAGIATFTVDYQPSVNLTDTFGQFDLDTDQNPATGAPGIDTAGDDSSLIGTDYILNVYGTGFQGNAQLEQYVSGTTFNPVATYSVTYSADSAQFSVPLLAMNSANGLMNFKLTSATQNSDITFSAVTDILSPVGQPVGVVSPVPEPSAVSMALLCIATVWGSRRR